MIQQKTGTPFHDNILICRIISAFDNDRVTRDAKGREFKRTFPNFVNVILDQADKCASTGCAINSHVR